MRRLLHPSLMLLNFLFLMVCLSVILSRVAHAQQPGRAYTLDHPIDPNLLILATPQGRYSIVRLSSCAWLHGDINVLVTDAEAPLVALSDGTQDCVAGVYGLVDSTPCFANSDGACDVEAGEHYF